MSQRALERNATVLAATGASPEEVAQYFQAAGNVGGGLLSNQSPMGDWLMGGQPQPVQPPPSAPAPIQPPPQAPSPFQQPPPSTPEPVYPEPDIFMEPDTETAERMGRDASNAYNVEQWEKAVRELEKALAKDSERGGRNQTGLRQDLEQAKQNLALAQEGIDVASGVDPETRLVLGTIPKDKIRQREDYLRSRFEDVQTDAQGNHRVLIDGTWTLVDPQLGLKNQTFDETINDVAGASTDIIKGGAAMLGGGLGSLAAGPKGTVIGAMAGAAGAGQIINSLIRPEHEEYVRDAETIGWEIAEDAAWEAIPFALGAGIKGAARLVRGDRTNVTKPDGTSASVDEIRQAYENQNIDVPTRAHQNPNWWNKNLYAKTEGGGEGMLASGQVMGKTRKLEDQVNDQFEDIIEQESLDSAGTKLQTQIGDDLKGKRKGVKDAYNALRDDMAPATGSVDINIPNTKRLLDAYEEKVNRSGLPLKNTQYDELINSLKSGNVSYTDLTDYRNKITEQINWAGTQTSTASQADLKKLAKSLKDDQYDMIERTLGKDQVDHLKGLDDEYARLSRLAETLDSFSSANRQLTPENFGKRLLDRAMNDPEQLAELKKEFFTNAANPTRAKEAWESFQHVMLERLGRANAGNQSGGGNSFSIGSFLTELNKLGGGRMNQAGNQKAIDTLFPAGSTIRNNIDDLRIIADSHKEAIELTGYSRSGLTQQTPINATGLTAKASQAVFGNALGFWVAHPGGVRTLLKKAEAALQHPNAQVVLQNSLVKGMRDIVASQPARHMIRESTVQSAREYLSNEPGEDWTAYHSPTGFYDRARSGDNAERAIVGAPLILRD